MEGLFQAGVKDINFVPSQWNVLTFRSEIRTELFPKVYLNPSDLWVKEQKQLIGTMITATTFQNLEGKKVTTIEENVEENIKYHEYENGLLIKEYVAGKTVFYEVVSKVEYKAEEIVKVDKPKENKLLDFFQVGLDIVGLVPVFGEAADGVNGVIYAARGDTLNAALSFGAMIPVAGWASTGGKLALKGNDLNQVSKVVSTEKMESIYSPIYQDVVNSSLGKTQNKLDILSNTHYQLGTPNALTFNMPSAKTEIPSIGATKGSRIEVPYGAHIGKVGNRKVLETNVKYKTTEGYTYETNEFGRIDSVDAELQLGKGTRNRYAQSNVGETDRIRGNYPERDDGGHLIASQFKGTGDIDNLVPMNSQINEAGGKWHQMEQEWASALGREGGSAKVKIKPQYTGSSARPDNFIVEYSIDGGRVKKVTVQNQNGG